MRVILALSAVSSVVAACVCPDGSDAVFSGGQPCAGQGPPTGDDCPERPGGGGGGAGSVTCPADGVYTGENSYITGAKPMAAPLRGSVGCVTGDALARRPTAQAAGQTQDAVNIYGPMEAGFSSAQPGMACLGDFTLAGGVDTNLAEHVMSRVCGSEVSVLDFCGGHAVPYHYHEKFSCLYEATPSGHSTRIGIAADGNGIYGPHIDGGELPTDLDGCGGRSGVTPDSGDEVVYYYPITSSAPFSLGCFGPATLEQCRALYDTCTEGSVSMETVYGTGEYILDCPCFDTDGSNVPGQGRPGYLAPVDDDNTNTDEDGEEDSDAGNEDDDATNEDGEGDSDATNEDGEGDTDAADGDGSDNDGTTEDSDLDDEEGAMNAGTGLYSHGVATAAGAVTVAAAMSLVMLV